MAMGVLLSSSHYQNLNKGANGFVVAAAAAAAAAAPSLLPAVHPPPGRINSCLVSARLIV